MRMAALCSGGRRKPSWLGLSALVALGLSLSWPAAAATSVEYQVKAAYLYKLVSFVDWPAGSLSSGAPLDLCVVGDDPFGGSLDQVVESQQVNGRALTVRRIATVSKSSGCKVLYIAGSKRQSIASALRAVKGSPSLTITEASEAASGSIIQFVVKEGRVRFTIDVTAANQNGLTVSAKLLSLALSVRGSANP
jgi:hypothetical protein